jgi:hypothetical protein
MKKIIASAGLFALGAASFQALAQGPAADKAWSLAATVRGFYDDNYTTTFARNRRPESFGFEVAPSASLNLKPTEQTTLGLNYTYGLRYYENRVHRGEDSADHSHQANFKISHAFADRFKADVSDSFVVAQEPEILEKVGAPLSTLLRAEGDNIRNTANATVTAGVTEKIDTVLGYSNTIYDYEATGTASRSALLDRMEHLVSTSMRWQVVQNTVGVFGYNFGVVDYTSDDAIGFVGGVPLRPKIRDAYSHFVFVGADHTFNQNLNGSVRAGVEFREFRNAKEAPVALTEDAVSPYVDANATWTYAKGSYLQLGVRHSRTQTDVALLGGSDRPTLDAETTAIYGSLSHQFWGALTGSVLGQFQHSTFEEGLADEEKDNFFIVGVNLAYKINEFLFAEAGYNYDKLDSDLPGRGFTRNRVYVGIRAQY